MIAIPREATGECEDAALTRRFKQGDKTAFDLIFSQYKDTVYSLVCRSVGPDRVDDVVQEAFIRIYRSLGQFRGDSSLKTWIYRVVMNTCADASRPTRWIDEPLVDIPEDAASDSDVETDAIRAWTADQIEQALGSLSPAERFVVELHYIDDLSYRDIAEVLKCPSGTVKARIHRSIRRLRSELAQILEEVSGQ